MGRVKQRRPHTAPVPTHPLDQVLTEDSNDSQPSFAGLSLSVEFSRRLLCPGLLIYAVFDCRSGGGFEGGFAAEDGSGEESNDKADG